MVSSAIAVFFLAPGLWAGEADAVYRAAQRAERAGESLRAYLLYGRAAALAPSRVRRSNLRPVASLGTQGDPEVDAPGDLPVVNPRDLEEARRALAPPRLKGSGEMKSFDLTGDPRSVIERVFEAYGLMAAFEGDYQGPPPFRFRLTSAGWREALRVLETVSSSFLVPVNERVALVVRDTPQKRAEMQATLAVALPIPSRISVQDAQEIVSAVQQTLEIRRISVDPGRRMIFLREQVTKAEVARALLEDLTRYRASVSLEVEFLSMQRTSSVAWGLQWQNMAPIVNFGSALHSTPSAVAGFAKFLTFGGGATFLGLGIADAQLFASLTRNSATSLLTSQVVTLDGQAATLHVGDRYPILTAGYFGNTQGSGQVYAPPPTVSFEDLGLSLKVTPSVHGQHEVTLDIESEFKVLGSGSLNGIPVIANRKFQGKVRLATGEWAVVAGLVSFTETGTGGGIWPLSKLPFIGRLFQHQTRDIERSEVLLVLKPRILSMAPGEIASRVVWLGSESRPLSPL